VIRFVVLLLVAAAVLYCVFWAIDRRNSNRGGPGPTRPVPRGPVGPDDDEDFLRDLDRNKRRERTDPDAPGEQ
jgi:hypothetical protein